MKKNIYIWGWHSKSQIDAMNSLENVNIIKWFSNFKGVGISMNDMIHKPYEIKVDTIMVDESIVLDLHLHFARFVDMYSRVNYSKSLNIQELGNIFNLYIRFFYNELKFNKVDYVLLSSFPHFGADYVLYLCAKILKIKIVMTYQTLFPNRFFAVNSIEDFQNLIEQEKKEMNEHINIEKKFEKDIFYMNKIKIKSKKCYLSFLNDLSQLPFKKSKPMKLAGVVSKFEECKYFYKRFRKNCVSTININEKYVYFPLHLQPEMSTSMLGGIYSDQLLAIEELSALLPEDWYIYVKENPKQTYRQRGEFFFKRLESIKKVKYICPNINTYQLMKYSKFVSVVTGTAGWEAISGGKCSLVFGDSWYQSLPGVFKYNLNIKLDDIISYKIKHEELEKSFNILLEKSYKGVVYQDYDILVDNYSDKNNKNLLIYFLNEVIK